MNLSRWALGGLVGGAVGAAIWAATISAATGLTE